MRLPCLRFLRIWADPIRLRMRFVWNGNGRSVGVSQQRLRGVACAGRDATIEGGRGEDCPRKEDGGARGPTSARRAAVVAEGAGGSGIGDAFEECSEDQRAAAREPVGNRPDWARALALARLRAPLRRGTDGREGAAD